VEERARDPVAREGLAGSMTKPSLTSSWLTNRFGHRNRQDASPAQAEEAHQWIRKVLPRISSQTASERIRIQYGGMSNPRTPGTPLEPDIDGALVRWREPPTRAAYGDHQKRLPRIARARVSIPLCFDECLDLMCCFLLR